MPVAALVCATVMAVLLHLRYGYLSGTDDHLVLSLQGLQWARPGFLVDDWFVRSAPQPHVLFDVVTWAGAAIGHLSAVYLAWWLVGLLVGGVATALLARAWAPRHVVLTSGAVCAVLALGPQVALGSTTPALPIALPHQLGGFLGYLTGVLLLTRRPRAAALACVGTAVVHVQIGALVAVVCVLAAIAVRLTERRWWWWPLGGAAVAGGVVVSVLRLRPVAAQPDDFVQICREVIPFHCDVPSWSAGQLYSGFAVVAAALLTVVLVTRHAGTAVTRRPPDDVVLWVAVVGTPALGLTLGVLADGVGVPVLGRLAQSTNIFRLAVLLLPWGAWGLVGVLSEPGRLRLPRRVAVRAGLVALLVAVVAVAGFGWLEPRGGDTLLAGHRLWALAAVLAATVATATGLLAGAGSNGLAGPADRAWRRPNLPAAGAAAAALLVLAGAVRGGALQWRPLRVTFVADPLARAMGSAVARHVPPGEVVEAPPSFGTLRLTSGRSLLVDCKAVPYGGAPWQDYRARLDALGGRGACSHGGVPYLRLPATALTATAQRYGARYLVLPARDPRSAAITGDGWQVLVTPSRRDGNVWLLAAPGARDAAAG